MTDTKQWHRYEAEIQGGEATDNVQRWYRRDGAEVCTIALRANADPNAMTDEELAAALTERETPPTSR